MSPALARGLGAVAALVGSAVAALGIGVFVLCRQYDESMAKVYGVPIPGVARSTDAAVLARGKHLVESLGGCAVTFCHGDDLGGGNAIDMGPLGVIAGPNITSAGALATYSDGELARLVTHGIKKDGHSVRLMPSQDLSWLPESDVNAIVSYVRAAPPVARPSGETRILTLCKILDRLYGFPIDVARRIDHAKKESVPERAAEPAYGAFVARLCVECHGPHLSGGRIPGTPSSIPIPLDLTADATGLAEWTLPDFDRVMRVGIRKNGQPLSAFMPIEEWRNLDDLEMQALWAYLRSLPPTPFGGR